MAKAKQALTGLERDAFELQVSLVSMGGEEEKKALIDDLVKGLSKNEEIDDLLKERKLQCLAYIMYNAEYAKSFKTALKPAQILEIREDISIAPYAIAENRHKAELKAINEAQATRRMELESKANTLNSAVKQQGFVNDLVSAKEWGVLAYLFLEPDGKFKEKIANVAVLLPFNFDSYLEQEARTIASQQYEHAVESLEGQVKNSTRALESVGNEQAAKVDELNVKRDKEIRPLERRVREKEKERADNKELQLEEISKAKSHEEQEINKIEGAGYKSQKTLEIEKRIENTKKDIQGNTTESLKAEIEFKVVLENKIKSLDDELTEDKEIGKVREQAAIAEKGIRSFFGAEVPEKERVFKGKLSDIQRAEKEEELRAQRGVLNTLTADWKKRGIEGVVKQLKGYDDSIAKDTKRLEASKAEDAKVLEGKAAEQRKKTEARVAEINSEFAEKDKKLIALENKIQSLIDGAKERAKKEIETINATYDPRIKELGYNQQHIAKQQAAFVEKKNDEIKKISTTLLEGVGDVHENSMKSLTYLAANGKVAEVVNYLYKGYGKDNAGLKKEFLNAMRDDAKVIDEMTAAIVGLSDAAKLIFMQDLVDSGALRGLKDRLDKLNIDKTKQNDLASRLIMSGGKFGPAYEILAGNNNLKLFHTLADTKVHSYETLKSYHDAFEDKKVASKSAGELLANSLNFSKILAGIPNQDQSSVNEKVNMAGILSDAYRAIERSTLPEEEKLKKQAELNNVYKAKIALEGGEYGLASILEKYDKDRLYAEIKIAVEAQGKVSPEDKGKAAEMLLFAPNLQVVGKTKDIVERIAASNNFDKGATFADKLRECFNSMLAALNIVPERQELMNVAAYMVGLKRALSPDMPKDMVQEAKSLKDQIMEGRIKQGAGREL